jgi:Ca2+-binding RTX toxin-like protein
MSGEHMRIPIAEGGTSGTNFHDVYYDPQDLLRDHAYHMQINARFDPVNGHLDVSRDGVMLVNYDGPLGWENMGSVYWKEGVYRADTGNPLAMDYSNLSIGSGGVGGAAVVSIPGASGDDVLAGPADRPSNIRGYAGDDFITGGPLFNDINGNQGDDTIVGRSTVGDWLLGGQGQDSIDASASTGANVVNGNVGSDTIVGGSGADTLHGGKGDDVIRAGAGQAWISGDLGTNAIYGGGGMNTFDAGPGHDLVAGWHAGDHVQVDSGVTYTVTQVNAGVQINFSNGGEMDLLNTQLSSLQSGWIFQA